MDAPHDPETCQDRACKAFACKLVVWRRDGLRLSWNASPTQRARHHVPARTPNNSWERGIATDSRGMPFLDRNLQPMGVKQYAENRSRIEAARRRAHQAPAPRSS